MHLGVDRLWPRPAVLRRAMRLLRWSNNEAKHILMQLQSSQGTFSDMFRLFACECPNLAT